VKTWTNEECGRWLDKWLAKAGFIVGKDVPTAADYYALTRTAVAEARREQREIAMEKLSWRA